VVISFQKPQGRSYHLHHLLGILRLEKADHFPLPLARFRVRKFFSEPAVDFFVQFYIFLIHDIVLDELPAHTEYALGIHRVGCDFKALYPDIFIIHILSLLPYFTAFSYHSIAASGSGVPDVSPF
jgi:hypothetical protein